MSAPAVIVEAAGITVRQDGPMTPQDARTVAVALLEASTAHLAAVRVLRRPAAVDEAHREREE